MLLGDIIFIAARGHRAHLPRCKECFALIREKVHRSLLKARDVYRAYIKRAYCKAKLDRYNQMLGLHVTVSEFMHAKKLTDCDEEEFFGYEFYRRTDEERDAYLTRVRRNNLARKVGDVDEALSIPGNKVLFNMHFGEFLRRRWINPTAVSAEEFVAFVRELGEVLVKASIFCSGHGIYKYRYTDDVSARALYKELYGGGYVVEEVLRQHPEMNRLNPHVINSVRVATYTDADEVHILAAAVRTSGHAEGCIDSLHAGGCACPVDVKTGVITADAFNNDFVRFAEHPLTHIPFKGFQIPMWEEAIETVRAASRHAYELPQCRILGWDLAFTPEGVAIIEGNWKQGCDLIQYGQGGIYHQLAKLTDKL